MSGSSPRTEGQAGQLHGPCPEVPPLSLSLPPGSHLGSTWHLHRHLTSETLSCPCRPRVGTPGGPGMDEGVPAAWILARGGRRWPEQLVPRRPRGRLVCSCPGLSPSPAEVPVSIQEDLTGTEGDRGGATHRCTPPPSKDPAVAERPKPAHTGPRQWLLHVSPPGPLACLTLWPAPPSGLHGLG